MSVIPALAVTAMRVADEPIRRRSSWIRIERPPPAVGDLNTAARDQLPVGGIDEHCQIKLPWRTRNHRRGFEEPALDEPPTPSRSAAWFSVSMGVDQVNLLSRMSDIELNRDQVALSGLHFRELVDVVTTGVDFFRPRPRSLARPACVIVGDHIPPDTKNVVVDVAAGRLSLTIDVGDATVPADVAVAPAPASQKPSSP